MAGRLAFLVAALFCRVDCWLRLPAGLGERGGLPVGWWLTFLRRRDRPSVLLCARPDQGPRWGSGGGTATNA